MRKQISIWFLLLAFVVTACGPGKSAVDPAPLTPAFASASADLQGQVSSAVTAISGNDFAAALGPLNAIISKGKLSQEQKDALATVLTDMQKVVAENQDQYTMEVYGGLSDLVGQLHNYGQINM